MIIKAIPENIIISYTKKIKIDAPENISQGYSQTLSHYTEKYDSILYDCKYINITKNMIPDTLFITEVSTPSLKKSFLYYNIELNHNVLLQFKDEHIAIKFLEIFVTDFENIDIKTEYPELYL